MLGWENIVFLISKRMQCAHAEGCRGNHFSCRILKAEP